MFYFILFSTSVDQRMPDILLTLNRLRWAVIAVTTIMTQAGAGAGPGVGVGQDGQQMIIDLSQAQPLPRSR